METQDGAELEFAQMSRAGSLSADRAHSHSVKSVSAQEEAQAQVT